MLLAIFILVQGPCRSHSLRRLKLPPWHLEEVRVQQTLFFLTFFQLTKRQFLFVISNLILPVFILFYCHYSLALCYLKAFIKVGNQKISHGRVVFISKFALMMVNRCQALLKQYFYLKGQESIRMMAFSLGLIIWHQQ